MKLEEVKESLPDNFKYKGRSFEMSSYSKDTFKTKKYPTRSKIIEWRTKDNDYILLEDNEIISSI